jgi:hypothetical protein
LLHRHQRDGELRRRGARSDDGAPDDRIGDTRCPCQYGGWFGAGAISGANNNDFSFTIELDTGYTLVEGDTVLVEYPAVDNPSEPGEYEVEVSVNEVQTATATITIE